MRQKIIVGLVILLMAALVPGMNALGGTEHQDSFTNEVDEAIRVRVSEAYGKLPLSFEANQGQSDAQVEFLSRGSGYTLFLTPSEAVLT